MKIPIKSKVVPHFLDAQGFTSLELDPWSWRLFLLSR
jgi:hypothetical protein